MDNDDIQRIGKELNLEKPWYIVETAVKTDQDNQQEYHVTIAFTRGAKFEDKTGLPCPIHNTLLKTWQHINFKKTRCYIHCKVPRIKTTDGKVQMISVPWARFNSRFSLSFETHIMYEIRKGTPLDTIGSLLGKTSPRIWTVFNEWINTAYAEHTVDQKLLSFGIDEISDKTDCRQISIFIDLKNENVLHITPNIGTEALQSIYRYLINKNITSSQIKHISGPFPNESKQFINFFENTKIIFPSAHYHIDRLYVTQKLNKAMDQIRKKETGRTKELTENRHLFLISPALLSEEQKNTIQKLTAPFSRVGRAYLFKNEFYVLWEQTSASAAEAFLESWCQKISQTNLAPLKRFAEIILKHKESLVHFSELKIDSTVMENMHKKILLATSRTKGLKNIENVSNMIYFHCGNLILPETKL